MAGTSFVPRGGLRDFGVLEKRCQGKRRFWVLERPQNQPLGLGGTSEATSSRQVTLISSPACVCIRVDISYICLPTSCA